MVPLTPLGLLLCFMCIFKCFHRAEAWSKALMYLQDLVWYSYTVSLLFCEHKVKDQHKGIFMSL